MKLEKIPNIKSEAFVTKLTNFLSEADLVEVSIKDSFGQNITGKLIEVFFDEKTQSPYLIIKRPYEVELSRVKLEPGEKVIAHKTRVFTA